MGFFFNHLKLVEYAFDARVSLHYDDIWMVIVTMITAMMCIHYCYIKMAIPRVDHPEEDFIPKG